jgi:hypothetical protein
MKFGQNTILNMAATVIVLTILLSGGVYAYSTRGVLAAGQQPDSSKSANSTTHTETQQTGQHENGQGDDDEQGENEEVELHFRLVPVDNGAGQGNINIKIDDTTLDGQIEVEKLSPRTSYNVFLVAILVTSTTTTTFSTTSPTTTTTTTGAASCTGKSLGSFVTRGEGSGEAELSTTLTAGTYAIGIVVCSGTAPALVPVLVSDPASITTTVPPVTEDEDENESSSTQTSSQETETHTVHTHTEDKEDEDQIKNAEDAKTIPAVVKVDSSGVSFTQLDPKFSVSASSLGNNGLQISISGNNVTGSRVLLVDLTGSQWTASSLQNLKVTYDGQAIVEAASISQLFSSTPTDPARYVILVTSSGLQLLVSIPHFSLHTIQILPSAASALSFFGTNWAFLLAGLVVFTALSVAIYSKRRRLSALLA